MGDVKHELKEVTAVLDKMKIEPSTASIPPGEACESVETSNVDEHKPDLILSTINIGNGNAKGVPDVGGAKIRRERVETYLNKVKPQIVFTQQIGAPKSYKWLLKVEGYLYENNGRSAGIAYSEDMFDEAEDVLSAGGLCGVILPLRVPEGKPTSRLLCVSRNAPYKIKKNNKKKEFTNLLALVEKYKQLYSTDDNPITAVLIAGTFHLSVSEIEGLLGDFQVLAPATVNCYNYFLYKDLLADSKNKVVEEDYGEVNTPTKAGCLRHKPVHTRVNLHDPKKEAPPASEPKLKHEDSDTAEQEEKEEKKENKV